MNFKIEKKPIGPCMLRHWGGLKLHTVCISLETTNTKKGAVQFNVSPVGTYHSFVDNFVSLL